MPKLEVPTQKTVAGYEGTKDGAASSAEAAARIGSTIAQAGSAVAATSAGLGEDMIRSGQMYFNEARDAINEASYNNAYANASTEFNKRIQDRMSKPYDENGNPTFQNLPSDISGIADEVTSKYGEGLLDGGVRNKFLNTFNNLKTNQQILAMGEARKQQQDYSLGSLQNNLRATVTNGLTGDPAQLGFYYSEGVGALNRARDSGYISAQEADEQKDKLRHDLYVGAATVMSSKDPVTAQKWIESGELNLNPLEKVQAKKINEAALRDQETKREHLKLEQQKIVKQQQDIQAFELEGKLVKGNAGEADLESAYSKGLIGFDQYKELQRKYWSAQKENVKNGLISRQIGQDVQSGNILLGYNQEDINRYYTEQVGLLTQNGQSPDLSMKAKIVSNIKTPVTAFTEEIGKTLQAGSPEDVVKATNAYMEVSSKNPLAASKLDKKSVALASYVYTQLKYTNLDPATVVANARKATTLTPELIKQREEEFTHNKNFTSSKLNKDGKLEDNLVDMYGLDPWLGRNGTIAPELIPTLRKQLQDAYTLTGDMSAAKEQVVRETKGILEPTTFNGKKTLMFAAPELLVKDAQGKPFTTNELRKNFESETALIASQLGVSVGDLKINSDRQTEQDLRNPSYSISDKNGKPILNPETGLPARWKPDANSIAREEEVNSLDQAKARQEQQAKISTEEEAIAGSGGFKLIKTPTDIPHEDKSKTADSAESLSSKGVNTLNSKVVASEDQAVQLAPQIGTALARYTAEKTGIRYDFGSKSTASGGIDCSGWVAENTLKCMDEINRTKGNIYDMDTMKKLMHQGAAWQISSIAKSTGYLDEQDVRTGRVVPGTLIGIRAQNVPSWAKGRPNDISHIVQVVIQDGKKYISQSAGSGGGVHLMPYDTWINSNFIKGSKLYAVNPFNLISGKAGMVLAGDTSGGYGEGYYRTGTEYGMHFVEDIHGNRVGKKLYDSANEAKRVAEDFNRGRA